MLSVGNIVEKEFYQESEWRYIPKAPEIKQWIHKNDYDNHEKLNAYNNTTKERCDLRLSPSDIKYIFVKNDSDIPEIINFIQTNMDKYSSMELKILMSRVISLESISADLYRELTRQLSMFRPQKHVASTGKPTLRFGFPLSRR